MSNRNRRQFLEDSMVAAAAAVATGSAGDLFAEEPLQSTSAGERLGVAVIGVRGRGNTHIGALAGRKDTEILYLCDPDENIGEKRVRETTDRQGGRAPRFVTDLRRCLDDQRVDLVTIATPNHWHALAAIWAIQAGKDVYVEKPVSHNVSEGRRIVEAARRYRKICQTGTQCRSNPGMRDAIQFVHSGAIGAVRQARGLCYKTRRSASPPGFYEVPPKIDYDLWLGPAPVVPLTRAQFHYDWHWQWPYGNGPLGNQGVHQMDLCRWGLGVESLSHSVFSYGGRLGPVDFAQTADTQIVHHDFGDRSLVFEVRGLRSDQYRGTKIGVIFEGAEGYVVMTTYHSGAAFDGDGGMVREFKGQGNHFDNFIAAVRSRRFHDLHADIEEGHLSSSLCHTANISYQLGHEVSVPELSARLDSFTASSDASRTLDRTLAHLADNGVPLDRISLRVGTPLTCNPKTESFDDHEQASALLTRPYRRPFVVPAPGQV